MEAICYIKLWYWDDIRGTSPIGIGRAQISENLPLSISKIPSKVTTFLLPLLDNQHWHLLVIDMTRREYIVFNPSSDFIAPSLMQHLESNLPELKYASTLCGMQV